MSSHWPRLRVIPLPPSLDNSPEAAASGWPAACSCYIAAPLPGILEQLPEVDRSLQLLLSSSFTWHPGAAAWGRPTTCSCSSAARPGVAAFVQQPSYSLDSLVCWSIIHASKNSVFFPFLPWLAWAFTSPPFLYTFSFSTSPYMYVLPHFTKFTWAISLGVMSVLLLALSLLSESYSFKLLLSNSCKRCYSSIAL